jgi:hypothetical protein
MPELRAPENSRTGIEIKPNVKYPDQTEAAIVFPLGARARRVQSLEHAEHFDAEELCR